MPADSDPTGPADPASPAGDEPPVVEETASPDRRSGERRSGQDRRQRIDLARIERGEPDRRSMPGLDRRSAADRRNEPPGDLEPET